MRWLVAVALAGLTNATEAQALRAGMYLGADYGWQQVIGGAQYGGTDVLAADVRPVLSASLGLRFEVSGWVFGGDLGFGQTDGNLRHEDPGIPLTVEYRNSSQMHFGAHVGRVVGGDWRVYGYLSETSRDFDVRLTDGGGSFNQADEQGILRFGVGLERPVNGWLSWRATLGSARAKFDGPTNMDPDREIEFALGVVMTLMGEAR